MYNRNEIVDFLRSVWEEAGTLLFQEKEEWAWYNKLNDKDGVTPPHDDLCIGKENPVVVSLALAKIPGEIHEFYPVLPFHKSSWTVDFSEKYPDVFKNLAGCGMSERSWAGFFFKEKEKEVELQRGEDPRSVVFTEKLPEFKGGFGLILISREKEALEEIIKKMPAILDGTCKKEEIVPIIKKLIMVMINFV